jgi:hypothetical protein
MGVPKLPDIGAQLAGAVAGGVMTGALYGGASAAINGGNIAQGMAMGAAIGGVTAGVSFGMGQAIGSLSSPPTPPATSPEDALNMTPVNGQGGEVNPALPQSQLATPNGTPIELAQRGPSGMGRPGTGFEDEKMADILKKGGDILENHQNPAREPVFGEKSAPTPQPRIDRWICPDKFGQYYQMPGRINPCTPVYRYF